VRAETGVVATSYYSWRAYLFDTLALGADGTLYLGQAEPGSQSYLYYPE